MKFKFPNADVALGFCDGLADPDGLDVAAYAEAEIVDVGGLDDHPYLAPQIRDYAKRCEAEEIT